MTEIDDTVPDTERPSNRDDYDAACCAITARDTVLDGFDVVEDGENATQ